MSQYLTCKKHFDTSDITPDEKTQMLSASEFNKLTIRYCHGATIYGTRHPNPSFQWTWTPVNHLPKTYIKAKATTPKTAEAFSKKIKDACYKANRIDYNTLKAAYKTLYRLLKEQRPYLYIALPNATTYIEVLAEDRHAAELASLQPSPGFTPTLSPLELDFYSRAFNLLPNPIYQTIRYVNTPDGFAACPELTSQPLPYFNDPERPDYPSDFERTKVPYTLLRDANHTPVPTKHTEVIETSLHFFLNLSPEDAAPFLADSFRFEGSTIVELDPEDFETAELALIQQTSTLIQKGFTPYQNEKGELCI